MKNKKRILIIIILSFLFSSIYAVTLQSPPAEYLENGEAKGRNIEIVQEGLRRMGYDSIVRFVPWKRALKMVKDGDADAIIDVAFNNERSHYIYFPDEVLYVEEWYAFKLKNKYLTLDEGLKNAGNIRLGASRGFEYGGIIQEAINNYRFLSIEDVTNNEPNILKLVAERFDIFIGVKLTILYLARQMGHHDHIEIVKMSETNEDYLLSASNTYLGFSRERRDPEIAEEFSRILKIMKEDGTVEEIERKYY